MTNNREPVICIDYKTGNRIRIHKITLHLLGDPDYIQLLINPAKKVLAVRKGSANDPLSIRVNQNKNDKDCYEIRSIELLKSLKKLYEDWEYGCCYRIYGNMDYKNRVANFKISDMTRIKELS